MNTYFALVHKDADSAFGASFPDLPGCFSAADAESDIYREAQTALALYAHDAESLPAARSIAELQSDPAIRAELAGGAFLIAVPLIISQRKSRYNIMLDPALVEGVDVTAETLGISRSSFIAQSLVERLTRDVNGVFLPPKAAATKVLGNPKAGKAEKSVAASALTQRGATEKTSAKVASTAAKVLKDPKASKEAKSAAASALTQKPGKK